MPRLSKIGAAALAAFGWTGLNTVSASYLVVAGGGGGGGASDTPAGGGGGAGGYLVGTTSLNPTQSYTVTVGAAGAGGSSVTVGNNGSNSVFNAITSIGGGGGGTYAYGSGVTGGSGGGAAWPTGYSGGAGTAGQGNAGGKNTTSGTFQGGGGGGGAGAVGTTVTGNDGGAGGAGTASSITGSSVTYAGGGGGGGGAGNNPTYGTGGSATGGGGSGGTASATGANGSTGTANLGGGGGGAGGSGPSPYTARSGGNGGSGVVIISYVGAQQFGGGIVTTSGANTIHTFQTSGTLSPLSTLSASYLIVAGGGGGGGNNHTVATGGGGGAGGLLTGSGVTIDTNSIYLVTVGSGGAGGTGGAGINGVNGTNSAFSMVTTAAVGGGYGATNQQAGGNGGSGGGASGPFTVGTFAGGTGTAGQGNNGGSANQFQGAGGGGAGAVGASGATGLGGDGLASSISGTSTYYAGGGGTTTASLGGGGIDGGAGTANTGGGGGRGAGGANNPGGNGGSGIVIISYAGATQSMAGGTVTISGGNVIHTFNSSGYLTPLTLVGNSLRFRSSASAYLSRTFSNSSTNNKILTYSAWVKRGILSTEDILVDAYDGSSAAEFQLYFDTSNSLSFTFGGASAFQLTTTAVYRDPAAWYHVVLAIDTTQATASNRVKFYVNGTQITAFSTANYPSQNATSQFPALSGNNKIGSNWNSGSGFLDGYLTEIQFIDGQALTPNSFGTFNSFGVWQPITYGGSYGTNGFYLPFNANTSVTVQFTTNSASNYSNFGGTAWQFTGAFTIETYVNYQSASSGDNSTYIVSDGSTYLGFNVDKSANLINVYLNGSSPAFTAPFTVSANAWAHLALVRSGSTVTMYVNGVARGSTTNSGTLGYSSPTINRNGGGASAQRVMSNLRICKSAVYTTSFTPSTTALTTTSQGATNCELLTLQSNPPVDASTNAYAVTTSGTPLYATAYPFAWNIFNDQGPAGNNWTSNNISGYPDSTLDYMTDVPTLTSTTVANYCVWNPNDRTNNSGQLTITNGNLNDSAAGGVGGAAVSATMGISSGKWYFEWTQSNASSNSRYPAIGWIANTVISGGYFLISTNTGGVISYEASGAIYRNNVLITTVSSYTNNDVIGVAYDADTGKMWFAKNGTYQASGNPSAGTNEISTLLGLILPAISHYDGSAGSVNFGQQPFVYTPPTNFLALNTFNI